MKLRSIITAGLLSTGLLMMSGCGWLEDEVEDVIEDALKTNVVHLANARSFSVEFTIDGTSNFVGPEYSTMAVLTGRDNYVVNNTEVDYEVTFPKDNAYLYGLCVGDNVITDSATTGARQVEVINLSNTPIDAGDGKTGTVTLYDSSDEIIASASLTGQILYGCTRETLPLPPEVVLSAVKTVQVNDSNYTVPEYNPDIAAKLDQLNDVDFDIVVFNPTTEKGTIVPMATAAQLAD